MTNGDLGKPRGIGQDMNDPHPHIDISNGRHRFSASTPSIEDDGSSVLLVEFNSWSRLRKATRLLRRSFENDLQLPHVGLRLPIKNRKF